MGCLLKCFSQEWESLVDALHYAVYIDIMLHECWFIKRKTKIRLPNRSNVHPRNQTRLLKLLDNIGFSSGFTASSLSTRTLRVSAEVWIHRQIFRRGKKSFDLIQIRVGMINTGRSTHARIVYIGCDWSLQLWIIYAGIFVDRMTMRNVNYFSCVYFLFLFH